MRRAFIVALAIISLFSGAFITIALLATQRAEIPPVPTQMVLSSTIDNPTAVEVAQEVTLVPLVESELPMATITLPPTQLPPTPTTEPVSVSVPLSAEPVAEQVVIHFDANTTPQQQAEYISAINGTVSQSIDALDMVVVNVPQAVADQPLPASSVVVASEPDYYVTALIDVPTSDVYYPDQWALSVIGAPEAWLSLPADAPTVTVAVIDSGVCIDHPDLAGRIGTGWDYIDDDAVPQDDFGHGCGVAGIIAANIDNGIGIAGVAPNAQIMPLRVLDGSGIGTYSDVAAAIVYAADNGAQIINLSLGGSNASTTLQNAIDYAIARDVLVIAAAGNTGGSVLYPAAYEPVIAVGSVDPDLELSSFSSRGPEIDLLAPGRDILTTTNGSSYTTMSGTSFAAPYASGVAALEIPFGNTLTVSGEIISIGGVSIQQPTPVPTELPSGDVVQSKNLLPKVSNDLAGLLAEYQAQGDVVSFASTNTFIPLSNELVVVNATSFGDPNILLADLQALGLQNGAVAGYLVSGLLPINSINSLSSLDSLQFVRPAYSMHNVGLITSQGDPAMNSDAARITYGVDGSGIMVGVLSDSYNCLGGAATDVASGDLPSGVVVLEDSCSSGTDEGRGMLQLIYDAAPGTSQAFHTAWTGIAGFATGITDLAAAGADVIVDDVFYADEPMFQDGAIAQSVDTVVAMGIPYFSSAGNQARQSYESAYRSSGIVGRWGIRHDFDPGAGVDDLQSVTIPVGGSVTIVLQWDQPFASVSGAPGSANDMDIYLYDSGGTLVTGSEEPNVGNDPVEFFGYTNPGPDTNFQLAIELFSGADPTLMKYVYNGQMTVNEFDTASPSSYGHANATGAEAVGAAAFYKTPSYGTNPPLLESFSSAGGVPILFDTSGNSIYDLRDKPEIVAPDGGNTTFFGSDSSYDADTYPNFFGTSAAAPHAAAVAALMLEYDSSLTPAEIYSYMETTAIDMGTAGFDYDSGHGLIDANAILAANPPSFCSTVTGIPKIECEALEALYASTGGLNWTNNSGWLSDDTPCTWYGVTCSAEHVTEIQLRDNQLSGTIPDLSNLTSLEVLNLKDNQLTGSIPTLLSLSNLQYLDLGENQLSGGISDLSTLTNLGWLYLNYNQLSGSIPDLSALTNLQQLDLSHNQFAGTIPNLSTLTNLLVLYLNDNKLNDTFPDLSALTSLQLLDLGDNQLTGSIPSELDNLTALRYLQLYNNQLTGSIPPEIGNLTHLEALKLYNNELTGSIPSEIGDLANLEILMLDGNQLSGNIPAELGNLSNLTRLQIPANQLTGNIPPELGDLPNLEYLSLASNQLSGSIPSELGNLTSLMHLYLYDNQLSGSIPPELGNLTSLVSFYLYNNSLSGSIPPELGSLTNLTRLILYNNQLSGSIPSELGDLTSLITLWLTENDLSGSIPPELSNLSNLLFLYLGDNSLSGSIPPELGNLPKLARLYLDDNNLSGAIPPELGDLAGLTLLDLSGNQLIGSIPPELCNLTNLMFLYLNNNRLTGEVPVEITNLVNISDPDPDLYLDIGYNCLTATDSTVIAYLNNKNPDWNEDQSSACPTTGFISGMIYQANGTTPLTENAGVDALDADTGDWVDSVDVNSDGTYMLALPPGDYRIYASGVDLAMQFYDDVGPYFDSGTPVTVIAGQDTSGIDFALDPAGSISGTVTDSSGNPLENISVDVHGAWIGDCTDENGHYYLSSIPLNTPYKISAFSDGWCDNHPSGYLEEYWQEVDNEDDATSVTAYTEGQEISGIDFTLQEGGTISGTIYEANGMTPITENAWVDVLKADTKDWVDSTDVESDGTYRITVPPGEYVIWAGAYDHVMEFYDNAGMNEDDGTPVTVLSGQDTSGIDFSLDPAGSISGVVTDEGGTPLANVGVDIEDIWIGDCTDENGVYHLYDVPLNTPLIIHAYGDSWCDDSPDLYPGEYWDDAATEDDATPVIVHTMAEEVPNINFSLALGGTISGTIYEANGTTPITENAWADALDADTGDGIDGDEVAADGSYQIVVPPGEYRVSSVAYDRALEFYNNAGPDFDNGTLVTVTSGVDTPNINFSLDLAGSISGIVTDTQGHPLPDMPVSIPDSWLGDCTDADGRFNIWSVPVGMPATVYTGGDGNWCGGSDYYIREYWHEVSDEADATPVIVPAVAADVPNINFTLMLGGSISGTVKAAEDNSPVEDVWVCAFTYSAAHFDEAGEWRCEATQSDGTYRIDSIAPVPQRVWLFPDDRLRLFYNGSTTFEGATPVSITPGTVRTGVNFSLPLSGIITGMVYDFDGVTPLGGVTITTGNGEYSECSQEDGSYRIFVPSGTYTVKAGEGICNSGVDFTPQYYDQTINPTDAVPVTVNAVGTVVENIDFVNTAFIDLVLTKSGDLDLVIPGDTLVYTLTVTNIGLDTATDVVLTDTLPTGMAFVTAAASQGAGCEESDGTVTCDMGSLPPTAEATVTVEVEVEPGPAGILTNTASVTANEVDSNEGNNTASEDTTMDAPPLAPSNLAAVGVSQSEITLSWQDNSHDEDTFFIERSGDGSHWVQVAMVEQDQTTYTDQGLTCNTAFTYRVRAYRAEDNIASDYTNIASTNTQICPALNAPLTLTAHALSRIQVVLTWMDGSPGETTQFHIERSPDGSAWIKINTTNGQITTYSDTGLACGTTYHYRVRAFREEDGTYSDYTTPTANATTNACPPPVTNTIGLYKDGAWQFRDSNEDGPPDLRFVFGPRESSWTPLIGDWDGDGVDGVGVYRDGVWYLRNSADSGNREISFHFNPLGAGALPLVGDWDGDNVDTIGVYKDGVWLLHNALSDGAPDIAFRFSRGEPGWLPVVGDWNGDGVDTIGLYKAGVWYLHNSLTSVDRVRGFYFGPPELGWLPVTGDWNEDGVDTVGLYKDGIWRLRNSNSEGPINLGFHFVPGVSGWQPVASYRGGLSGLSALGLGEVWLPETPEAPPTDESTTPPSVGETEIPEVTETVEPVITEEAPVTEAPEVTDEPTVTEIPVITEEPIVTKEPPVAEEPVVTKEAPVTEAPVVITEVPVATEPLLPPETATETVPISPTETPAAPETTPETSS